MGVNVNSRQISNFFIVGILLLILWNLLNIPTPDYLPLNSSKKCSASSDAEEFAECFKSETFEAKEGTRCGETLRLSQDSEILREYVLKNHLIPPSALPYNFTPIRHNFNPRSKWENKVAKRVLQILKGKKDGFYIEAGANDGMFLSNSLTLERDFNWKGLLVEADPLPPKILKNRNRQAWIADVGIATQPFPHKVQMRRNKRLAAVSYNPDHYPKGQRERNQQEWENFEAACFPLYTMLLALGVTEVDYFSMDLEGIELAVLKTIPFDKINIKVFSIESLDGTNVELQKYLIPKGYVADQFISDDFTKDQIFVKQGV